MQRETQHLYPTFHNQSTSTMSLLGGENSHYLKIASQIRASKPQLIRVWEKLG
jgi:hypothetical protein